MAYCCPDPDDRGTRKGTLYTLNLRAAEIAPEAIDPLPGHGLRACRRFLIHILYAMERVRRDSSRKSTERRRTRPVQNSIRCVGLVEADPINSSVVLADVNAFGFRKECGPKTRDRPRRNNIR